MSKQVTDDQSKVIELSDQELDSVAGGDIHFTKTIDKASPNLFSAAVGSTFCALKRVGAGEIAANGRPLHMGRPRYCSHRGI
jgi:hypothetical protein